MKKEIHQIDRTKDFYGKELPKLWDSHVMTVDDLKEQIKNYPDDAMIYMEASNAYNKNDTMWSQRAIGTYACTENMKDKKALMIVGTIR